MSWGGRGGGLLASGLGEGGFVCCGGWGLLMGGGGRFVCCGGWGLLTDARGVCFSQA
eukprot:COSAG02_NODE_453_length_22025_cov_16.179923_13_plen_57_part_00